jgi:hypothetical protein
MFISFSQPTKKKIVMAIAKRNTLLFIALFLIYNSSKGAMNNTGIRPNRKGGTYFIEKLK